MRDWIVLRFSSDVPPDTIPEDLDGHWVDKADLEQDFNYTTQRAAQVPKDEVRVVRRATAHATGNFEINEKTLEFAEIWEIGAWE